MSSRGLQRTGRDKTSYPGMLIYKSRIIHLFSKSGSLLTARLGVPWWTGRTAPLISHPAKGHATGQTSAPGRRRLCFTGCELVERAAEPSGQKGWSGEPHTAFGNAK